ncbi:MAG: glycoside hydrolase family 88 protein [Ignavibacteria bacterium]|jgi:rhamnogalacturonyl hydrolase YesR
MLLKKISTTLSLIALIITGLSCESGYITKKNTGAVKEAQEYALSQLRESLDEIPLGKFPIRTKGLGEWELTNPDAWTSGFYPGCLWLAYQLSNDPFWIEHAVKYTEQLEEQQYNTHTHDIGFMMLNSYGNALLYNDNEKYKNIVLQSAKSLATRFNEKVGCIQSWDGEYQVIIDNMMNLDILFWAAKNGGGSALYDIAVAHANKTIKEHLRDDGSSFHVVVYDMATGEVKEKRTAQGYSDNSAWARGQAWGTYGFTVCFRETKDETYLNTAIKMADYFIEHLPADGIPYWDLTLPDNSEKKYKDASAAAIFVSALLELREYVDNPQKYDEVIENMLGILIDDYLSAGTESNGILLHCAYNANSENPYDWDAATSWGDYYFLEAIKRYLQMN